MSIRVSGTAIGEIQNLFRWGAMGSWTDSQLMTQFLAGQDGSEAAFRMLIHRHGPMVLGVCRRILGDEHAAEDAFQATFLVLVQEGADAPGLRLAHQLAVWGRPASGEQRASTRARRRVVERQVAESSMTSNGELDQSELRSVIDEEIRRFPERYRLPLVLCHVEGLRHDEVAAAAWLPDRDGGKPIVEGSGAVAVPPRTARAGTDRLGDGGHPANAEIRIRAPVTGRGHRQGRVGTSGQPAGIVTALVSIALPRVARLIAGLYSRAGAIATALVVITWGRRRRPGRLPCRWRNAPAQPDDSHVGREPGWRGPACGTSSGRFDPSPPVIVCCRQASFRHHDRRPARRLAQRSPAVSDPTSSLRQKT